MRYRGFVAVLVTIVGVVVGFVVGAIVAVNVVIYSGIDRGYEASPSDVFSQNPVAGILALAALIAGPVTGVYLARRVRGH